MVDKESIKSQRDRFLGFSFASADLLLEVSNDDQIKFALGAGRTLTGVDHTSLVDQNWLDLFHRTEKISLISLRKDAIEGKRCGPLHVKLNPEFAKDREAIVSGIKMPGTDSFFLTASFVSEEMIKLAQLNKEEDRIAPEDKDTFIESAQEALGYAKENDMDVDLTLLDIPNSDLMREKLGDELWDTFTESITEILAQSSVDGYTASEIAEGRYGVVHDKNVTPDSIKDKLSEMAKEKAPDAEGLEFEAKTVEAEVATLSERDAAKALVYTINEFERKGTDISIDALNSGFKNYVNENAQRIQQFKTMVSQLNFQMHFQPIVDLATYELAHFEMLVRFKGEGTTQEWIMFGEEIGMAPELDMAICERAINYLKFKAATNSFSFAVNLSGQSIQSEQFFDALHAKLSMHKNLSSRLIFEITESTEITDLTKVNNFVKALQNDGFKVCLDDFGAGSASFQYLQELHVDYLKIDGKYSRKILTSERDQVMIKNLSQMCKDLKVKVVAERIEHDEQAQMMKSLGVDLGQGYFFSEPKPNPEYAAIDALSKATQDN